MKREIILSTTGEAFYADTKERVEIVDAYLDKYADEVYDVARDLNRENVIECIGRYRKYAPDSFVETRFSKKKLPALETFRAALENFAIGGYVAQFSREEMVALLDALRRGTKSRNAAITICKGCRPVELWELADRWNRLNAEEEEVQ